LAGGLSHQTGGKHRNFLARGGRGNDGQFVPDWYVIIPMPRVKANAAEDFAAVGQFFDHLLSVWGSRAIRNTTSSSFAKP